MKSGRFILTLGYNTREQSIPGVWENVISEKVVKAQEEYIIQSRIDLLNTDHQQLTKRFRVRSHLVPENMDYVIFQNKRYKVRNAQENIDKHWTIIELGELI